jgi:hypothetical protein
MRSSGKCHCESIGCSSLSEVALPRLLHDHDCVPLLMERDQYPLHHVFILAIKATLPPPQREHLPQDPP